MRTTVTIDDDIFEAAQHLSRTSGRRLGEVLSELARRGLRQETPPVWQGPRRFPVFDIPADSPIIPASRVQQVLDGEGVP
jgi:hypothetical protein